MGSKQIILDNNLTYEIWRSHLFREIAPWFESFFDEVDVLVNEAESQHSSLVIKNSPVYNQWLKILRNLAESDPAQLQPLLNHIHASRNHMDELVVLPSDRDNPPMALDKRVMP